jgi:hypothetical protein
VSSFVLTTDECHDIKNEKEKKKKKKEKPELLI